MEVRAAARGAHHARRSPTLAAATPRGVFFDRYQGHPVIPLEVPLQVERDKLLHDLPRHIRALVERIEGLHDSELIQMSGRPREAFLEATSSAAD